MAAKEGPVEIVKCLVEKACINIKDDNGVNIYYCSELVLNLTYSLFHCSFILLFEEDIVRIQTQNIQNHPFIVEKNENNHQKCTFTIVFGYTAKPVNFWIMLNIIDTIFDFVSFHYISGHPCILQLKKAKRSSWKSLLTKKLMSTWKIMMK